MFGGASSPVDFVTDAGGSAGENQEDMDDTSVNNGNSLNSTPLLSDKAGTWKPLFPA